MHTYGALPAPRVQHEGPKKSRRWGIMGMAISVLGGSALIALAVAGARLSRLSRVELSGVIGNDAGPSSRWEGSNAQFGMPSYGSDAMNAKEEETGFGVPGQLGTGPDYYSTANWDNAELYPSLMNSKFDPYVGQGGCPGCKGARKTYMFSVDPRCDGSYQCRNIRKILKLDKWDEEAAFQAGKYQEKTWIGNQAGFFIGESKDVVMVVPPCFFPPLANAELNALNDAIYGLGGSILVLGGLTGANFISQNLRGKDGHGYVDTRVNGVSRGSTYPEDSPKFTMDCVWSGGPFVLQNSAINTEFFYGPRFLEGTESTWGIPVNELPPETIHYYMSADQISIVFEIPAGNGRIMFMGYDFGYMAPHWIEALMLARREMQIDAQYPAVTAMHFKQLPRPQAGTATLGHVGAGTLLHATISNRPAAALPEPYIRGSEKLPAGADGDAIDMEVARAVDKLEDKMAKRDTGRNERGKGDRRQGAEESGKHAVRGSKASVSEDLDGVLALRNEIKRLQKENSKLEEKKRSAYRRKKADEFAAAFATHTQSLVDAHEAARKTPAARGTRADEWLASDAAAIE